MKKITGISIENIDDKISAFIQKYEIQVDNLRNILQERHNKETADFAATALTVDMPDDFSIYYGTLISRYEAGRILL
ncbi:hypothetical protein [uncultured Treponema sp.]|uniref:hypothetical protein n=1 Tax=uncultured Treponema sp. TaxID=162155 RepID=UPI0025999853|nr:hypothetical protein [uncultured Treponema sp.]